MAVTSRQTLIEYALRRLGAPVIEINVDEDQIEDRVDEALQFYREYHSDAMHRTFFKYQLQAADITNGYITVPDTLAIVTDVVQFTGSSAGGMFSYNYQSALNDFYDLQSGASIAEYSLAKAHMEMLNMVIGQHVRTRFSRHMNRIYIDDFGGLVEGDFFVLKGMEWIDPEAFVEVYNDIFLKKYLTVLIKEQWGSNLKKFGGMQLPGGVTLEGQPMFDEAQAERLRLEEEIRLNHEEPVDFFIG